VGNPVRLALPFGSRREIRAGGGYGSEDAAVQVMGTPETPTSAEVRWPGGRTTTRPIPSSARSVTIGSNGRLISEELA
jgi:ASPIC and UnbV